MLCISGFAPVEDITKTISTDLKLAGNLLFIIGETKVELGGSVYYDLLGELGSSVPKVEIKKARKIFGKMHQAIQNGLIVSAHDVSEGGLAVTVAEMCFGGDLGAHIDLEKVSDIDRASHILFSESQSRFVVEISPENEKDFVKIFQNSIFK